MNLDGLKQDMDDIVNSSNTDLVNENANTDGKSPTGMMGLFASQASKAYSYNLLEDDIKEAFLSGYIHIHDFDYYATGTTTCCQLPLGEVLKNGFKVGECFMREPRSIGAAMALAAIMIQSNQNQQHGGQSFPNWDFDLAPYAEMTYNSRYKHYQEILPNLSSEELDKLAYGDTEKETFQAAEAFVHNANSMLCRNGMQVPFVSINFGLDTSKFGKMITRQTLLAQKAGLGDGSTPIFPILVYKIKEGINFAEGDPNYDDYQLGLECLSKRLFPNFQFVDTPFNGKGFVHDDPKTHIATMGCRTRVFEDVNGPSTPVGRGNLSFTTLNLPMIAIESNGEQDFKDNVARYVTIIMRQLLNRLEYQKSRKAYSFKILYGEGIWNGGKELDNNDEIGDVLNTGSLSVGYVGLAEALTLIKGKHHAECEESQAFGLELVSMIRKMTDEKSKEMNLNFSVLATPAESYCGNAQRKFRAKYGVIEGVSDHDFFTNSNHVPVWYSISAQDKIKIEAPYHALTNAGHIAYVEVDGAAARNIEALDDVVKLMAKHNIGYGSINHPVDRCISCGHVDIIDEDCPICGNDEISRIRRITGYLVGGMDKWNSAKAKEESMRVKHGVLKRK